LSTVLAGNILSRQALESNENLQKSSQHEIS